MNFNKGQNNRHPLRAISWKQWMGYASFIILIGLLLGACANDFEKIKKFTNIENLPKVSAQGYEMLSSDSTILRFKLQTPEMIIHDEERVPYTEFPQGVEITQYDSRMNVTSFITSRYAKYFTDDDRWEAKNNVIAVNQKGDTLKTEYLVWDRKKGKIYSDQFVQIIQKDQITSGTSFESNQDFSEYTFKNLKGQMYIEVQDK